MADVTHVVSVSGGAASAVCLFRVLDQFPGETVRAVFADTGWEHPDCYRFIDDIERLSDVTVERLGGDQTIWDVFFDVKMLTASQGGCIASWNLKRLPLLKHAEGISGAVVTYIGFGPDEDDRIERIQIAMPDRQFDFPLTWPPSLFRCDTLDYLALRGITPPSMYADGYPHANCGGACILAGIKQWSGLLRDDPELYRKSEENEQQFLAILKEQKRKPHTILRDRRGGKSRPFTLRQLRTDIETGRRVPDDSWRQTLCSCMTW